MQHIEQSCRLGKFTSMKGRLSICAPGISLPYKGHLQKASDLACFFLKYTSHSWQAALRCNCAPRLHDQHDVLTCQKALNMGALTSCWKGGSSSVKSMTACTPGFHQHTVE